MKMQQAAIESSLRFGSEYFIASMTKIFDTSSPSKILTFPFRSYPLRQIRQQLLWRAEMIAPLTSV